MSKPSSFIYGRLAAFSIQRGANFVKI